jgi:hypothetical protein
MAPIIYKPGEGWFHKNYLLIAVRWTRCPTPRSALIMLPPGRPKATGPIDCRLQPLKLWVERKLSSLVFQVFVTVTERWHTASSFFIYKMRVPGSQWVIPSSSVCLENSTVPLRKAE